MDVLRWKLPCRIMLSIDTDTDPDSDPIISESSVICGHQWTQTAPYHWTMEREPREIFAASSSVIQRSA